MPNWRELPSVKLLLPFIAGILLAIFLNIEIPGMPFLLLIPVALLYLSKKLRGMYRYRWLFGVVFHFTLLTYGYWLAWNHNELNQSNHFSKILLQQEDILMAGTVNDAPVRKEEWIKIELKTFAAGHAADSLMPVSGNVLLYLARDSAAEALTYGDKLVFRGNASAVEPPRNPDAFDYHRYLHFQNIHYQAFVREENWTLSKKSERFSLFGTAISLQNYFTETLRKHLGTKSEFAVGAALILGYRDEIPENILTAYSQTGAMHVLAVSGLHVGIVFLILNFFLKRVKRKTTFWRYLKAILILAVIWIFALVTGASPSVNRAAVMFSFVTIGGALNRNHNFYNTLAASALVLLFHNPFWLASVSFQLSYLAVFGIVFFQPKFNRLLDLKNKYLNYCWQLICVSLAAQLMTLPLTLYYFNQFPFYFWLSSLILVPLAGVELGLGLLLLLTEAVWQAGALWVGKALWALLWFGNASVSFIQKLPGAVIEGIWVGAGIAVLLYLTLSGVMVAIVSRKFRWMLAALAFLLVASLNFSFSEYRNFKNRHLVVYDIYKHTALDFFDGKQVYSLTDQEVSDKSLGFTADGYRFANSMGEIKRFHLEDTAGHEFRHWFFKNGFVQFYDLKLAVISEPREFSTQEKINVDYLLIRGTPKIEMGNLMEIFDFKTIIFDASNKKWQLEQWKIECEQLGVEYFDVNEQGAFLLDLRAPG